MNWLFFDGSKSLNFRFCRFSLPAGEFWREKESILEIELLVQK